MQPEVHDELSPVVLEYLELIYTLHGEGSDAYAVTLAEHLNVSRANASATVQRLIRDGLVQVAGRRIVLTEAGRIGAETGLRRHRITERFLTEVLRIPWQDVHNRARSFERGLTPLLLERIDARVGFPRTCPHGNPIPRQDMDAAGYLAVHQAQRLTAAQPRTPLRLLLLSKLVESATAFLHTCFAAGLLPGALLSLESAASADLLAVRCPLADLSLPAQLAASIWVTEVQEGDTRHE